MVMTRINNQKNGVNGFVCPLTPFFVYGCCRRLRMATICAGRRAVVAAGDYVRAKTPLRSVFTLTSIAPTHAAIASVAKSSILY
jgi:hypothetical protein